MAGRKNTRSEEQKERVGYTIYCVAAVRARGREGDEGRERDSSDTTKDGGKLKSGEAAEKRCDEGAKKKKGSNWMRKRANWLPL